MKGYNNNVGNNSKLQKLRDVGIRPPRTREQKQYPLLNMVEVDNNSQQTQPSNHLISLKTQKTDPNEFFIEQSLVLKKNTDSGL